MRCQIGSDLRCVTCGRLASSVSTIRNCRPPKGLGDLMAAGLSSVGITKERASRLAAAVGVDDCGCRERQEWLNQAGYRLGIGTPPPPPAGPTG